MEQFIIYLPGTLALLGLLFMFVRANWVGKQDAGEARMQSISKNIQEGAMAFLRAEYKILLIFVIIASVALFIVSTYVETTHWIIVVAFVFGAFFFSSGRQYRDADCDPCQREDDPSGPNQSTSSIKSIFFWRDGHGTRSCRFSGPWFKYLFSIVP